MIQRLELELTGLVQGVGFRPFAAKLAASLGLAGSVANHTSGVSLVLEGAASQIQRYCRALQVEKPSVAEYYAWEEAWSQPQGMSGFCILPSQAMAGAASPILPDLAPCSACLAELANPEDRRFRYPFLNCTHCGPRYSILARLPYDRANTAMAGFPLCPACQEEYQNPQNRRYHAQPTACPVCGPQLQWLNPQGKPLGWGEEALQAALRLLDQGGILAWKGIGGFLLSCRADQTLPLQRLRQNKQRRVKPFALLVRDLALAQRLCSLNMAETNALQDPSRPIVLALGQPDACNPLVAPGNPYVGVMLPSSPLHHLLSEPGWPLVATSGNQQGAPLCLTDEEALAELSGFCDGILTHNRPILRRIDDSIVQVIAGQRQVLRRARGFAPLPLRVQETLPPALGLGGDLKSSIALSQGQNVYLSQHLGDLDHPQAQASFCDHARDLQQLLQITPQQVFGDLHPGYRSTRLLPGVQPQLVQHHAAHLYSLRAEAGVQGQALGFAFDGTGLGLDKQIWGGEVFLTEDRKCSRLAHLRPFPLIGGEIAAKEPLRIAFALIQGALGKEPAAAWAAEQGLHKEARVWAAMWEKNLHCPLTTSMGRLFDGVAGLLGLCRLVEFEGQAAMALEFALSPQAAQTPSLPWDKWDWRTLVQALLQRLAQGATAAELAAGFHNALVSAMVTQALAVGCKQILFSGGCFQNRYLQTQAQKQLQQAGLHPFLHQRLPPNDGGLAMGQLWMGIHQIEVRDVSGNSR